MSTPAMLRTPDPPRPGSRAGADPLVTMVVSLLALVIAGLFVAGTMAVYDWTTPRSEGPLAGAIAAVFGLAVLALLVTSGIRAGRRVR